MSLETEGILDRRRLRRHLSFWRIVAVVALTLVIAGLLFSRDGGLGLAEPRQIARLSIDGMITESRPQLRLIERIGEARHVEGVILHVNSPGGTTAGGEALFDALRRLAAKKPVVAQFGTVAASAAYMAGLGADHIVARGNTITGSIGVIMQWPEVSGLLDKLGVKVNEIKSGPLKANPSPFQPIDQAGRELAQRMIEESRDWFVGLVGTRRQIRTADVPGLEQGRVFSGREALAHRLVDEIGGELEARKWLEDTGKVRKGLKIVDWKPGGGVDWPFGTDAAAFAGRALVHAINSLFSGLTVEPGLGGLALDGLVSVWHPSRSD
jgi:protease-4